MIKQNLTVYLTHAKHVLEFWFNGYDTTMEPKYRARPRWTKVTTVQPSTERASVPVLFCYYDGIVYSVFIPVPTLQLGNGGGDTLP